MKFEIKEYEKTISKTKKKTNEFNIFNQHSFSHI